MISKSNFSIQFTSPYISLEKQDKGFVNMEGMKTPLDWTSIFPTFTLVPTLNVCYLHKTSSVNWNCPFKDRKISKSQLICKLIAWHWGTKDSNWVWLCDQHSNQPLLILHLTLSVVPIYFIKPKLAAHYRLRFLTQHTGLMWF